MTSSTVCLTFLRFVFVVILLTGYLSVFSPAQAQSLAAVDKSTLSKKQLTSPKRLVTGHVKDADTGIPIANAKVKIQGKEGSILTTMEGNFAIEVESTDQVLEFSYVDLNNYDQYNRMGYHPAAMQITDTDQMMVLLPKVFREEESSPDEIISVYFVDGIKVSKAEYDQTLAELKQKGWIVPASIKYEKGVRKYNIKSR
jgi:hypothetical protein